MKTLDLETRSLDPDNPEYALQPWRLRQGKSEITMVAVGDADRATCQLDKTPEAWTETIAKHPAYFGWNVMFDVAYLYASGYDVRNHTWLDAMLIVKWVENCPDPRIGYSLAAAAKRWLGDWLLIFSKATI